MIEMACGRVKMNPGKQDSDKQIECGLFKFTCPHCRIKDLCGLFNTSFSEITAQLKPTFGNNKRVINNVNETPERLIGT